MTPRALIGSLLGLTAALSGPSLATADMAMPMPMSAPTSATPMAGPPTSLAEWAHGAMLFQGLAKVHRTVTTTSPVAQRYFDQGMALMWGFNHDEAARSFAKAAEVDPRCAACFWGLSLTVGPNYNLPFLTAERAKVAFEAVQRAKAEATHA